MHKAQGREANAYPTHGAGGSAAYFKGCLEQPFALELTPVNTPTNETGHLVVALFFLRFLFQSSTCGLNIIITRTKFGGTWNVFAKRGIARSGLKGQVRGTHPACPRLESDLVYLASPSRPDLLDVLSKGSGMSVSELMRGV
jgi:hypothetical protein